jgi:hypothetical protein
MNARFVASGLTGESMRRERRILKCAILAFAPLFALLSGCSTSAGAGADAGAGLGADAGARPVLPTVGAMAIASDSTGTKLVVVVAGGGIWTSTDGGGSWIERAPSGLAHIQQWTSVASDSTGTKLVAVVNGFYDRGGDDPAAFSGDVWTSTDSGATWTDQTASSSASHQAWRTVASDASGTKLVAATAGLGGFGPGAVWTSTDAGATWTNRAAAVTTTRQQGWSSVASDATGINLFAVGGSGVWVSNDGGAAWTDRTPVDPKFQASFGDQIEGWSSVASDATGTRLVAAVDTGDIWTSADGGVTWVDTGPAPSWQVWTSVASNSTGTNLVAIAALVNGDNSDVWTSANGGQTWTDRTAADQAASGPWWAVASNAAGDHLVAVGRGVVWVNHAVKE